MRRSAFVAYFLGGVAAISGMPSRAMAADPIYVSSTSSSGASVTSAELRAGIDRSGALEHGTASLPAGAAGDRRIAWFPIVFSFGVGGCLSGAYDFEFISRLTFDCGQGAARIADLFPQLELGVIDEGELVLIIAPAALASMCEPCSRIRPALDAELARRGIRPTVIDVDLILF